MTSGERELYVYTPPGYDRAKTYPVLYLLGWQWRIAVELDLMTACKLHHGQPFGEKKPSRCQLLFRTTKLVHRNHPKHSDVTFKLFEAELRRHVIPLVEREYAVRRGPKGRALSGLSMGGRHTMFVGFNSLDLFASFGALSAGDMDSENSLAKFLNDPDVNQKVDYLFWARRSGGRGPHGPALCGPAQGPR